MPKTNSISQMTRKMTLAEIKRLIQLIGEELDGEEQKDWLLKLKTDEGATEDELWDLIWDLNEDFAESLESTWEDRKPADEKERKKDFQKRYMRKRDL